MAQREPEMMVNKHGRAHTKVAGDDEMLRTGFHNGTPLEAGKIADSDPVDLFAPVPQAPSSDHQQQQQRKEEEDDDDAKPAAAPETTTVQGRQGMAPHVAGGRRLGRQA